MVKFLFTLCFSIIFRMSDAANILAVFPFSAKSHFTMFQSLLEELHSRGHNLTVVSHFPKKHLTENYTDISLVGMTKSLNANMSLSNLKKFSLIDNLRLLNDQINDYVPIFKVKGVQNLINSTNKFDLMLAETFNTDMFLAFAHKFNCPVIAMSASPLMPWAYKRIGLPLNPSIMPLIFSDRANPMSIIGMLANTIEWFVVLNYYKYIMNSNSEDIARKHFGNIPPLQELSYQTSLILVNTHCSLHSYGASSKKLIEVGGMHIKQQKPLESNLEKYLNQSDNGVIVFSMGSMFRAETIPKEIFTIFINVFSRLEQNILWKWESNESPEVKNIKFMKWLPQRDVLAHPNIKLFIYHGGLLGTSEAIYCGVPILGLPQFGDMPQNMAAIGEAGISLSLGSLTEDILQNAIYQLISNPRYKAAAERLSALYRDRPKDPLAEAVYWVEYTIRHNGTSHLFHAEPRYLQIVITYLLILMMLLIPLILIILVIKCIRLQKVQKLKVV